MNSLRFKLLVPVIISSIVIGIFASTLIFSNKTQDQQPIERLDLSDLKDIYGSDITVKSNVVVHFFASWCPSCKTDLVKFAEYDFKNKVPVIAVSLTDTPSVLQMWLTKAKLRDVYFRICVPSGNSELRKLNIKSYPQTFVIGKDGKVLYHANSVVSNKIIEDEILPKFGFFQ